MLKRLPIAAILLCTFTGCDKIMNMANVNVNLSFSQIINAPEFDSTAIPSEGLSTSLPIHSLATNSHETLAEYKVDDKKVARVTLKGFSQKILGGANKNFDFVDTILVYASAKDQPEKLIAYNYRIPKNVDSVALECVNENLKSYVMSDTLYMRVYGHFNDVPHAADYEFNFNFKVLTNMLEKAE